MNNNFGNNLNNLKIAHGLSSVELAHKASISAGLLSGLIHNQRVIGEYTARKIGKALHLDCDELEDFVYLAINNGCSEKVLSSFKDYPSQVLNLVASELSDLGIPANQIKHCVRNCDNTDAALYLDNGTKAIIRLEISIQ